MKEVFFLNTNKAWGGGEKWHLNAAIFLQKRGYTSHLVCYPGSELSIKAKQTGLKVSEIRISKSSFLNPITKLKLRKILAPSDILFLNLPQDFKIGTLVAAKLNYKKIIYRRGMPHPIKNSWTNKILFSKLTHIIANSYEIKKSLSSKTNHWFPADKVHILYNGVNTEDFTKQSRTTSKKIRIGCIGRLVKQKAFHEAIEVAKKLKQRGFNFSMTIAGKGDEQESLERMISLNDLAPYVKLIGHVDDVVSHMSNLDYFLFTSHFEGSPNTLIEAMASKLVCFAYNTSSMPEIIVHKQSGYLAKKSDTNELTDLIIAHNDPNIRINAYKTVEEKFSYSKNMNLILKIIS